MIQSYARQIHTFRGLAASDDSILTAGTIQNPAQNVQYDSKSAFLNRSGVSGPRGASQKALLDPARRVGAERTTGRH